MTAGCLVAGCTGGGEPAPSPPVETSAEPSETETPEPEPTTTGPPKPERPAAMERDDAEGAAAAAEYFLELYPYVMSTGDTAEWDAMTWAETCGFCTDVSTDARSIADADQEFVGGEVAASLNKSWPLDTLVGGFPVDLDAQMNEARVLAQTGVEVRKIEGFSGVMELGLMPHEYGWKVLAVSVRGA
ncbi:DUF6318 family protein [Cellulosimicrobium funkei]